MKYKKSNSTGKQGVNFVRGIVISSNCIFHEIDTGNDLGVDGIIEIIKDEIPTNRAVSVQIKSGNSFYKSKNQRCEFPIGNHRLYWENYHTDLFAIVYVPETSKAYWIDLKRYLKSFPTAKKISFPITRINVLTEQTFSDIFIQLLLTKPPNISFNEALDFFSSSDADEFDLGLFVLFSRYSHFNDVWDILIDFFLDNENTDIPEILIHYLSHCPWHPDLAFRNETFTKSSRDYGKSRLSTFSKTQVVKLLEFIDSEMDLGRGRIGQSVESIVSIIQNRNVVLESIILDVQLPTKIREYAGVFYAYYVGMAAVPTLRCLSDSNLIGTVIAFMEKFDENFELYV